MKETQKDAIRRHLLEKRTITPLEALGEYGCMRLAARIADLKKEGMPIRTDRLMRKTSDGTRIWFARYVLDEEDGDS